MPFLYTYNYNYTLCDVSSECSLSVMTLLALQDAHVMCHYFILRMYVVYDEMMYVSVGRILSLYNNDELQN